MQLSRKNWPDGWIPSDNAIGGRKTGLLRMDNLYLDDNGIVKLVPGLTRLNSSPLSGTVHSIYSQNFDNRKIRFAGLSDGSVIAAASDFSTQAQIITGGNAEVASFATMYGWVFAASGRQVVRYNIDTVENVGMHKPDAPLLTNNIGPVARVVEDYNAAECTTGTLISLGTDIQITTADNLGVVLAPTTASNTMLLSQDGTGAETDVIQMPVVIEDSTKLVRVRLEFKCDDVNYYYYQWEQGVEGSPLNEGIDVASVLFARRSDFIRAGDDSEADWTNIATCRMSVVTTESIDVQFQRVSIHGGNAGTLKGPYQYRVVGVTNVSGADGVTNYQEKSPPSDPSDVIYAHHNTVNVYLPNNPPDDYAMDEWWIYRRSAELSYDINPLTEPRRLDQWYRVGVVDFGTGEWEDTTSDADALEEGKILDTTILSIADIQEDIAGMTGLVNARNWYLTTTAVIPSIVDNPGAYRPAQMLKLSGSSSDKNLWIQKGDDGAIYVGTTEDVYRISGSYQTLNDGTIDANVKALGLGDGFQPISRSCTNARGSIFYLSASGWIELNGTTPQLLVGDLDFLFRKVERHGFPYVSIVPNGLALYAVCVRNNQLWCSNNMSDGTRRLLIYDFARKYWHVRNLDPVALFCEDDGTILGGFGGGSGNYINQLDTGTDLAGINGQNFHLLTTFDDFDRPNQRKDVFTYRIWAKSSGTVSIELAIDGGAFEVVGTKNFGLAGSEFFVQIPDQIEPSKNWALQIKGTDLEVFEFYGYQIEFDERPVQQNYLRVPPTNQGTISRKRWTSYALVIDTLGNPVSVTPYVDNVASAAVEYTTSEKLTIIYYFLSETVGTDISAIIRSMDTDQPFEFYTVNLEETVSEKLPTPTKFLVIPANDYGNPNRKRHSSYKFSINTRGQLVRFTPKIDGVFKSPIDFSTSEKRTQAFYFNEDNIGVDIGGTLESLTDTPFEFYGVIVPQDLEVFPPQLEEFRIPENNYGVAAKKRIRTMPMRINTNGTDVTFTPIVDNVRLDPTTFNTPVPTTVFHYFITDVFGVDFSGELLGTEWFEFYGLERPESVEVLPVGKKFDQVGPIALDRVGKLLKFRIRAVFYDSEVPVSVYVEDTLIHTFTLDTLVGKDKTYEQMQMPKTIVGTTMRIEIGPTANAFHRYTVDVLINLSGMDAGSKWYKLQ